MQSGVVERVVSGGEACDSGMECRAIGEGETYTVHEVSSNAAVAWITPWLDVSPSHHH